jgi:hypothetical protein
MQTAVNGPAGVPALLLSQITANSSESLTKDIQGVKFIRAYDYFLILIFV